MDTVFHCQAELKCSAMQAFEYFTRKELIESWLVPLAEVEEKVGGNYQLFWEPDDRKNNSTIGCKVTALQPGQLIAFEWKSPRQYKAFANSADPLTHVVVCFFPNEGGTLVHLVHSGWRSAPEWKEAAAWQERAWTVAFQELEKKVNGSTPIAR